MKKCDLQNFDIVELRDGEAYMVKADNGLIFGRWGWMPLSDYEENLANADGNEEARYYDIVRVRRPEQVHQYGLRARGEAPIIWERKEKPKISHEEEVILRALNKPEWWIARDYHGLFLYKEKPVFETEWWGKTAGGMTLYDHLFDFIEKDKDCYQVKDLLGDGENT